MGFIDYHGTKVDRYSDIIEYAEAQQAEDWRRKQDARIKKWLNELKGDSTEADLNIHDILKTLILRYQKTKTFWDDLLKATGMINGMNVSKLWEDLLMAYAMRHIEPFHLSEEKKIKYFDALINKAFNTTSSTVIYAEEFYQNLSKNMAYRRYLTECFDPAWKGQQIYKYVYHIVKKDKKKSEQFLELLGEYRRLGIETAMFMYQSALPKDDGWMIQESAEYSAVCELEKKIKRGSIAAPDIKMINDPLKEKVNNDIESNEGAESYDITTSIPRSKLKRKEFEEFIEMRSIPGFVGACKLILECDLPEDIKINYDLLIKRMPILQDSIEKFDSIYHADIEQLIDYYAPEALKVTATLLDYMAVNPSENVLEETHENVALATKKLVQVINEKIDEIYKFVTIETNAQAKAIETVMSQDGYIDPQFKIN